MIASGADRPAGRELVLKVEEASWLPSAYRDLETFLHGHLPATDATTGLVLILTDREHRAERIARARQALAGGTGPRPASGGDRLGRGRRGHRSRPHARPVAWSCRRPRACPRPVAALIGSATPLQLLTERLARARGTNPDPIRRDDPVYVAASDAAEG